MSSMLANKHYLVPSVWTMPHSLHWKVGQQTYLVPHVWTMPHYLHWTDNFPAAPYEEQSVRSGHWLPTATSFTPLILWVPVPSQDLDFQRQMSWFFFVFNGLWWDEVVCFVDIGGIIFTVVYCNVETSYD